LHVTDIGVFAQKLLAREQAASVIGVTSRGFSCTWLPDGWFSSPAKISEVH